VADFRQEKLSIFTKINYKQMKNFTITIPDNKENIFVEMMKSISFVKKIEAANEISISEEHQEMAHKRIHRMEEHPESCLSWEDIERKVKL